MYRFRPRAALLVAALLAATTPAAGRRPVSPPRNILLITIDTLRRDHLGFMGNPRPISPNLDRLAAESVVFENAWSCSGWTIPSLATIMTGRGPKTHGARDFNLKPDPTLLLLAEALTARGYDTRAYVSHFLLTPAYGLDRGFRNYDVSVMAGGNPHDVSSSRAMTDLVLAGLPGFEEPFFTWVHYFDPHYQYLEHPEWRSFGDRPIDRYDQEIACVDQQVGRILDLLRERGLDQRTVILLTADHGEEFDDHGGSSHETCFNEVVRVPLIVRVPGEAHRRDPRPARQIDILPTLLTFADVPPVDGCRGRDLLAPAGPPQPLYVERDRPPGWEQRAVIDGRWKLVRISKLEQPAARGRKADPASLVKNVSAGTWLYDLSTDPAETHNLLDDRPEVAARLLQLLDARFLAQTKPGRGIELSPEVRERLRSLGYIG